MGNISKRKCLTVNEVQGLCLIRLHVLSGLNDIKLTYILSNANDCNIRLKSMFSNQLFYTHSCHLFKVIRLYGLKSDHSSSKTFCVCNYDFSLSLINVQREFCRRFMKSFLTHQ